MEHIEYYCGRTTLGWLWVGWQQQDKPVLRLVQFGDEAASVDADSRCRLAAGKDDISFTLTGDDRVWQAVSSLMIAPRPHQDFLAYAGLVEYPAGTAFQREVWQAIAAIPPGQVRSYRQLAQQLGRPRAVRAVASACGANPLALIIPCHRVLRSDGGLGGYRWGLQRKQALLAAEGWQG